MHEESVVLGEIDIRASIHQPVQTATGWPACVKTRNLLCCKALLFAAVRAGGRVRDYHDPSTTWRGSTESSQLSCAVS
jgi:hypothetical protein